MIFLALLVPFSFQGARGLYETSEGRYAECAREMIERGDFLQPTLDYQPHWTKPPLTYWAIAAGIKLLGPGEWGIRLYSSLAFALTALAVASIGTTLWGKTTGFLAGIIYLTSPYPTLGASTLTTDMLLTLWETLAVLCYLRSFRAGSSQKGGIWITVMWLCFGLGFLTKGPPALIPLLPIIVWHLWHKPETRLVGLKGLLVFAVVGLSWYVYVVLRNPGLVSYFFGQEVVGRVASSTVHNHEWYKPVTMYLPVLIFGAGAWLYFAVRTAWQERVLRPDVLWQRLKRGGSGSFLFLWLVIPLILFSLVKSRLWLYVLPLHTPVALVIARGIGGHLERFSFKRVMGLAICSALVLVTIKGVTAYYPNKNNMRQLYNLCEEVGVHGRQFVLFDIPQLYGLQYYLDGRIQRVCLNGKEAWASENVRDFLSKVKGTEKLASCVFIARRDRTPELYRILKDSALSYQSREGRFWSIVSLKSQESLGFGSWRSDIDEGGARETSFGTHKVHRRLERDDENHV